MELNLIKKVSAILSPEKAAFANEPNAHNYIVNRGSVYHFIAIQNENEKTLLVYNNDIKLKINDRLINESDANFFVKDVALDCPYKLKVKDKETTIKVQKVIYAEKPIEQPKYFEQASKISSKIEINASNSSFGDIGNILNSQNIDYKQVLNDLENAVEFCYNVEELRKMVKELKTDTNNKKEIKSNAITKFSKFMGTHVYELAKIFLGAYLGTIIK
jgi:hypothetical protein